MLPPTALAVRGKKKSQWKNFGVGFGGKEVLRCIERGGGGALEQRQGGGDDAAVVSEKIGSVYHPWEKQRKGPGGSSGAVGPSSN